MPEIDWRLLREVSRSFYLTLRLLPDRVRPTIALAYLLARLSDTRADGANSDAERELLAREDELRAALKASEDREEIAAVWATIQEGQDFDGSRFTPGAPPLSPAELDRYTYLVAGCVGEFWTRVCAKHLPRYARLPQSEMLETGVQFGKGLQYVNVLRDRVADASLGRMYLRPEAVNHALAVARGHLLGGAKYVKALRSRRLRMACALPLLLGRETLDLIEKNPDAPRVKVPRRRVWLLLARSVFF